MSWSERRWIRFSALKVGLRHDHDVTTPLQRNLLGYSFGWAAMTFDLHGPTKGFEVLTRAVRTSTLGSKPGGNRLGYRT